MQKLFIPSKIWMELRKNKIYLPHLGDGTLFQINGNYTMTGGGVLYQQVFDHFEETYHLYSETYSYTEKYGNKTPKFGWEIRDYGEQLDEQSGFDNRNDARNSCILRMIEYVIEKPKDMFAFGYVLEEKDRFLLLKDLGEYKKGHIFESFNGLVSGVEGIPFYKREYFKLIK